MRAVSRFSWCAAALAVWCALPASATAASRTKRRGTRTEATTTPAPAPETAVTESTPESAPAVSSATDVAVSPANAVSSSSTSMSRTALQPAAIVEARHYASIAGGADVSLAGGPIALEVVARAMIAIPVAVPKLALHFVVPLRFTTPGESVAEFGGAQIRSSSFSLALIPSIQVGTALTTQIHVYGGFGFGPAHFRSRVSMPYVGDVNSNTTVMEFDFNLVGFGYALDDRFTLLFEPVGIRLFTGGSSSYAGQTVNAQPWVWTMLLGVSMSL